MDSELIQKLLAKVTALEEELQVVKAELASYKLYKEKYEQAVEAYDCLLQQYKELQRYRFGKRSEKHHSGELPKDEAFELAPEITLGNGTIAKDEASPENNTSPSPDVLTNFTRGKKKKSRRKTEEFLSRLPKREVIIPFENKTCPCCGEERKVVRYEETELLHRRAAVKEIIVQKREVVACRHHCEKSIQTAPSPLRLLQKACVTNEFLAYIIVAKLYDRQPLYHLEKKFIERFDFICSRAKLARWFIDSAEKLYPLINLMQDEVRSYDIALCDPTHLQVLNEPGRKPETKSYLFCIRGGEPGKDVVLYQYNATLHKDFLLEFFEGFEGYLQVDGQNIFDAFEENPNITLVYCNAHARRKFEAIAKLSKKPGLAAEAMEHYKKIYEIEREAKNEEMTPEERFQLRQEKSKPLIEQFEAWLEEKAPTILPKSSLGLAFEYTRKRKVGLKKFLEDGRLEIDTNSLEQKNKDFALGRNNFLFSYSVPGAHALGIHQSLIVTAVTHGLDPYQYYCYILERIPYCKTIEDFEALLPWNAAKVLRAEKLDIAA
jgi:transposase